MANKKGIFIAENMASTKLVSLLRSATQETEIENGSIVKLGDLVAGKGIELHKALPVAAVSDAIYVVDGVELDYDEQTARGLDDFVNPANQPFRVRKLMSGDVFSVSESMLTGTVTVGKVVEPAAGNKLKGAATATASISVELEVLDKWVFGTRAIPMVRLQVK